jgi:hypothetical protein
MGWGTVLGAALAVMVAVLAGRVAALGLGAIQPSEAEEAGGQGRGEGQ